MSGAEFAHDLTGSACARACPFCGVPVFVPARRAPDGQFLKDAGDFILPDGQGLHRRHGLLAQHPGPLDFPPGVRQRGRMFPFASGQGSAEFRLLPLAARLRPLDRRLMAAKTLPTQSQQLTRPLDCLERALLQGLHSRAQFPPALIEFPFAFIDLPVALSQRGLAPVSITFPLVSHAFPLVSQGLTLVSSALALLGHPLPLIRRASALIRRLLALICRVLALIRCLLTVSHGLMPS